MTTSPVADRSSRTWATWVPIFFILLVAFVLRLEHVFQPLTDHFSWREASTAMMADNLPDNGWNPLWPEVSWTGDLRGYQGRELQSLTIAAAALDHLFGWRDWHGRLVAAICGLISTFSLYRLVALLAGRTQGLVTALLWAVAPGVIMIESSYLPDPAMGALLLAALWLLAEARAAGSATLGASAGLVGTAAFLAKLPALAALPAALYLAWPDPQRPGRLRKVVLVAAGASVSLLVVAAYYRWAIYLGRTYPPFHIAGNGWIWQYGFQRFLAEGFFLDFFRWHATHWLWGKGLVVLAVVGFLLGMFRRGDADSARPAVEAPWFFYIWAAGGAIFYVVAAKEVRDNSWNLHVLNPVVIFFAGLAVTRMAGWLYPPRRLWVIGLGAGAVAAAVLLTMRPGLMEMKHQNVGVEDRRMGLELADRACAADLVATTGTDAGSPTAILYSRRRGFIFPPPEHAPNRVYSLYTEDGEASIRIIDELVARGARWFGAVKEGYDKSSPPRVFASHFPLLLADLRARAVVAFEDDRIVIFDLGPIAGRPAGTCPE